MPETTETTYVIDKSPKLDDSVRYPQALKSIPNAPSFAALASEGDILKDICEDAERETLRWEKLRSS